MSEYILIHITGHQAYSCKERQDNCVYLWWVSVSNSDFIPLLVEQQYLHHQCDCHPCYLFYFFFRYGRRRTTQLPVVLALIFGIVAGLSPNLYFYLVSQFIIAATLGGYRINSIVLGTNFICL